MGAIRRGDPREVEVPALAVHERRPEQEHGRAEAADDQVLQARFEAPHQIAVDRAEDVERQRQPLEPEEERQQVVRADEEDHPGPGGREQRVVLRDVVVAHALAERDCGSEDAAACDEHLRERRVAVATECVGDDAGGVRATDVQCDGEAESDRVAEGAEGGGGSPARRARDEHGAQECERQRDEERVHRCEREPVDVRALDHGFPFASGP